MVCADWLGFDDMSLKPAKHEEDTDTAEKGVRSSLRARFHAWWEGYGTKDRDGGNDKPAGGDKSAVGDTGPTAGKAASKGEDADAAEGGDGETGESDKPKPLWTTERISVAEQLWGEGFTQPGGPEYVSELIKPLGLDNSMHVLDLGAGLGGVPRAISEATGTWMTGYEADAKLAARANMLSEKQGMAKKVPIKHYDSAEVEFKPAAYDAVISREALFTFEDKKLLFGRVVRAVKPFGQILFTDYMLPRPGHASPAMETWKAVEPQVPFPWSLDEALSVLNALELDVRIHDDITDRMRLSILEGWGRFSQMIATGGMSPAFKAALLQEVELWARRVAMLESGDLKVYRVYARKLSGVE